MPRYLGPYCHHTDTLLPPYGHPTATIPRPSRVAIWSSFATPAQCPRSFAQRKRPDSNAKVHEKLHNFQQGSLLEWKLDCCSGGVILISLFLHCCVSFHFHSLYFSAWWRTELLSENLHPINTLYDMVQFDSLIKVQMHSGVGIEV